MDSEELIKLLENHPSAKPAHRLLALDLKIHQHPENKDALITAAIEQYKNVDQASLIALAGWLNSHGEYERELETVPGQRAMQTRELFFQHVDALGALGRWDEIRRLIESEQFPLDPVVEHMYLARCFAQQDQAGGAENNWKRALEAAAGDLTKLITLGDYAEKNGALDVASSAYEAAATVSPQSRPAQQGRLRIAYAQRDTKKIHAVLGDLLKQWPNDSAVQNDEAYVRVLLLPPVRKPTRRSRGNSNQLKRWQRNWSRKSRPVFPTARCSHSPASPRPDEGGLARLPEHQRAQEFADHFLDRGPRGRPCRQRHDRSGTRRILPSASRQTVAGRTAARAAIAAIAGTIARCGSSKDQVTSKEAPSSNDQHAAGAIAAPRRPGPPGGARLRRADALRDCSGGLVFSCGRNYLRL